MAVAAAVGEAFLSAFIEVVLDRLASPDVVNLIRGKKVDVNLVQRLKNTLYAVEAVLNDAEQKQFKDSAVNKWLDDLKDAVYVADDILDHISTKAATSWKKKNEVSSVTNYFSRFFNVEERNMVCELENIVARLEYILKFKDILGLQHIATHHHSSWRTPSTSLEDIGSNIFGRDHDKEAILKLLLDDANDDEKVSVIPIVGMGGVGKTTLAQSVYNHDSIKQKFDVQAWACVSDHFDELKVTKAILEAVTGSVCTINNKELLHRNLKEILSEKKFFIVLDDIWTEDYDSWNSLLRPLQYGSMGSKILVTTRIEKVASMVKTIHTYHLEQLSGEDCWLVFANHACLSPKESIENMELHKIGKKIIRKCKGLPLAAQSLGGLLRGKHDMKDWNNILNSNIWENESKIIPALRISYHYLPPYLKRCFVYCSLYPKDHEFDKDDLILLWMAEDLLQLPKNGKTLEEVGCEYFKDLTSRSFFQCSGSWSQYPCYVMHDLVHDLATLLGGEFYLRREELNNEMDIGLKARHLSFSKFIDPIHEKNDVFGQATHLRTFFAIDNFPPFNIENASYLILSNLKCLRVLSFQNFPELDELSDSIGELIHLRYLNLSSTDIETIPESLCNLYNSQTLKLRFCCSLTKLPNDMQKLVNLRHLDINETSLEEMPREMSKLSNLQHLSWFPVGKHVDNGIKELGTLSNLHESLSIKKLENVICCSEASEAKLMDKKYLEELLLSWSEDANEHFTNSQSEMDILGKLQPCNHLKRLDITNYRGTKFPEWISDPSYHNLTELTLFSCRNCCIFPPLGHLGSLKKLMIRKMSMLETIGNEYGDSFPGTLFLSLEYLEFDDLPCWEIWHHSHASHDSFPSLKTLTITDCPKLKGDLPSHLPNLVLIVIRNCHKFVSFPREGLSAPNLKILSISGCTNLKSLPCNINILLPKLEEMGIFECPEMETFPEGGMPPSLRSLSISDCEKLLRNLSLNLFDTMLSHLSISGPNDGVESFPNKDFALLPPSLTSLELWSMSSLHTLECTGLLHLTSLQQLTIGFCPKLENIEGEKLPASLIELVISNCPLLEERYRMKHPQIWPKISHIKGIQVIGKRI